MKEIAQIMKITPRTVAFHKYSMMHELGIKSSAGLVQYAVKLGGRSVVVCHPSRLAAFLLSRRHKHSRTRKLPPPS